MAAGFGLFISEEALNIWVCVFLWYFVLHPHMLATWFSHRNSFWNENTFGFDIVIIV
jgi:hypothetical protein